MKLILGSLNQHKINAVEQALVICHMKAEVSGMSVSSGVDEQPDGLVETHKGAHTRALRVLEKSRCDIAIGIESGILRFHDTALDLAFIVLVTKDGRKIVTTSSALEFPEKYVKKAEKKGFTKTTVGSVISEELGGDASDPHSVLTNKKIKRNELLVDALVIAFRQL